MFTIKLSNILIILSILVIIGIKIYNKIEYQVHINKLDNLVYDDINTKYIGYIEIERVGVKRGIVKGIDNSILNNNDIGYKKDNGKIILAGHSVENVFGKLHKVKLGDIINLYLNGKRKEYKVISINVVDKKDVNSLNDDLNLITCMYNPNKRLIIGAKKNT